MSEVFNLLNLSSMGGGHMCDGVWKDGPSFMCYKMHRNDLPNTFELPTDLSKCEKCSSENVDKNGKCLKCGHITSWLQKDRPYYNLKVLKQREAESKLPKEETVEEHIQKVLRELENEKDI